MNEEPVRIVPSRYERAEESAQHDALAPGLECDTCGAFLGYAARDVKPHQLRDCVKRLASIVQELGG